MKVLIVEDESFTAELLKNLIEKDETFEVYAITESVAETVELLRTQQVKLDLCFFDIKLADGKSFEIFKHIDVYLPVIFCTAYDDYTMQAFKNSGIDYVLKPFEDEEISAALEKYKRLISLSEHKTPDGINFSPKKESYQKLFLSRFRDKTVILKSEEVALFRLENNTVWLYNLDGQKFPVFKKLEYFNSVCNPDDFFRVNRQTLVSKYAIQSYQAYGQRRVELQLNFSLNDRLIVSRLKVSNFKLWLER